MALAGCVSLSPLIDSALIGSQVHVDDLVPLYVTAFQRLIDADGKKLAGSPYERYVIATRQWLEIRTWLGIFAAELYKLGKVDSPEMISIPYAEASPMEAL